jgi:hypothetical protein
MATTPFIASPLLVTWLTVATAQAQAQQTRDSTVAATPAPPWQGRVLYGGGPSVGAPPSDYTGATAPAAWCLQATRRATGDLGTTGRSWTETSRSWLRHVLSDTTDLGAGWRRVLGDAPRLAPEDSIIQVTDERKCREISRIVNRDLLGWRVGPPPIVVFRIRDFLIAYPSNAPLGEFGLAVGMSLRLEIRGVATW